MRKTFTTEDTEDTERTLCGFPQKVLSVSSVSFVVNRVVGL